MIVPVCPVCGARLECGKTVWTCFKGHSFDIARQGYVNLLTVQQKHSLSPGDTREMVVARRNFLDGGYYFPIVQKLKALIGAYAPEAQSVLDVGCGEGYYLSQVEAEEKWGIDISKEATRYAAVRDKSSRFLTATAAHLPFENASFDCLLSMFALTMEQEFARVLKNTGIFIQVLAGENHLTALKSIIYPTLLEKPKELHPALDGFTLLHKETLTFEFHLDRPELLHDLLYMTPHVWRISKEGAEALKNTLALSDRAEVVFNVYGRQAGENLIK